MMGGGKAPKEYIERMNKEDNQSLDKFNKFNHSALAEFLSNRLEYSPEFIDDLLKEFFANERNGVTEK